LVVPDSHDAHKPRPTVVRGETRAEPWTTVLDDSKAPFFKWFVGAKTNIVHNAIDRHLKTHRRNKLALIWEGEKGGRSPSRKT
jgi:Acetyl-coenzyme A synthetase N-terminus